MTIDERVKRLMDGNAHTNGIRGLIIDENGCIEVQRRIRQELESVVTINMPEDEDAPSVVELAKRLFDTHDSWLFNLAPASLTQLSDVKTWESLHDGEKRVWKRVAMEAMRAGQEGKAG